MNRFRKGLRRAGLQLASGGIAAALAGVEAAPPVGLEPLIRHAVDGAGPHTFDPSSWGGDTRRLPIGVFDSGIGGLTVLEAMLTADAFDNLTLQPGPDGRPDLEGERFLYFGDKANMPYGNYASAGKSDFLRELVLKYAIFLLGRRWRDRSDGPVRLDKPPVKAIVIACNTATAAGLEDLRSALAEWRVPVFVVGVVEAGATGVLQARRGPSGGADGAVAVMATVGTCATGAYPRMIRQAFGRAGRPPLEIVQQGSPDLAGLIEGDPAFRGDLSEAVRREVRGLLDTLGGMPSARPVDTVVLGCTHFPLALREIEAAFAHWRAWTNDAGDRPYAGRVAGRISYVDPADWTARELFRELASARLRLREGEAPAVEKDAFFVSVPNPLDPEVKLAPEGNGLDPGYKYGRDSGRLDREDTVIVPMRTDELPTNVRTMLRDRLPAVWERLAGG